MASASSWGTASAKAWESSRTASTQRCCAVLLGQNVLLSGRQQRQKLLGCTRRPLGPVEAVEEGTAHLPHRLFLIEGGLSRTTALGVQCLESLG